jgi:hypothetical protein
LKSFAGLSASMGAGIDSSTSTIPFSYSWNSSKLTRKSEPCSSRMISEIGFFRVRRYASFFCSGLRLCALRSTPARSVRTMWLPGNTDRMRAHSSLRRTPSNMRVWISTLIWISRSRLYPPEVKWK